MNRAPRDRPDRAQDFDFLIAQCVGFQRRGRLHCHQGKQLHQVILQHVAQRAGLVVVIRTIFDARLLGYGDLDVVDEVAVPNRLDHQVGKSEHQQVLHRLLGQVVIDAINLLLVEVAVQQLIQRLRAFQVHPERLLDHNAVQPARAVQAGCGKISGHGAEVLGLDGQVEHDVRAHAGLGLAEFVEQPPVGRGILKVTAYVTETRRKSGKTFRRELLPELRTQRLFHVRFPVRIGPFPARKRDEVGYIRQPALQLQAI